MEFRNILFQIVKIIKQILLNLLNYTFMYCLKYI